MFELNGKNIPETLDELLIPLKTAHIIIDLQKDICYPNGLFARAGGDISSFQKVIQRIAWLTEESRKLKVLQIFVKVVSLQNGLSDSPSWIWLSRRMLTQYKKEINIDITKERFCQKKHWGSELIDELKIQERDIVIEKHRSSAFFGTNLDMILRSNDIHTLMFSGCTTEGCVETSVRDAGCLDYFPIVIEDGVASDVPLLHKSSLTVLKAYRAVVITANEAIEALQS